MVTTQSSPPAPADARDAGGCNAQWYGHRPQWLELVPVWRELHQHFSPDDLGSHPDWCQALESACPGTVQVVCLRQAGDLAAVVPFLLNRVPLRCQLGRCAAWNCELAVLRPAAARFDWVGLDDRFHALLRAVSDSPLAFDALRLTVPTASRFWRDLRSAAWSGYGLRPYQPFPPLRHFRLRLPPSFAEYGAKFTSKTRKNRCRELRHLQGRGAVVLDCFTRADQIEEFLALAGSISRLSYQQRVFGAGLGEIAALRRRLNAVAGQGWWRSYVLRCGGAACSYMLGYQYAGWYYYVSVGYDPAWARFSVGSILQWLVLQDLYRRDTPEFFDFGSDGPQKQYFSNEGFEEGTLWLFRPGLRRQAICALHRSSVAAFGLARRMLEELQLSDAARRALHRLRGC